MLAEYHKTIQTETQKKCPKPIMILHQSLPAISFEKIIFVLRNSFVKNKRMLSVSIALCSEELSLVLHSLVGKDITYMREQRFNVN